jgi:hypothetical protein
MIQENAEQPDARRIRRWAWTLCLVLTALMLGFFAGYYLRPIMEEPGGAGTRKPASAVAQPEGSRGANSPSSLMEAVVKRTRQWKGDANAPVTIVEFGDYQ